MRQSSGSVLLCILCAMRVLIETSDAAFLKPDFISSWFSMTTSNIDGTYKDIVHGLGELPIRVQVLVKAVEGNNEGFIFQGTGTAQADDDLYQSRGSPVYGYNDTVVRIWLPYPYNGAGDKCYAIFVGGAWGGNQALKNQASETADFKVLAWRESSFYTAHQTLVTTISSNEFQQLNHSLGRMPEYVLARAVLQASGFRFDGAGCQMSGRESIQPHHSIGGLLYGYNEHSVRLWTGPVYVHGRVDGWGNTYGVVSTIADIEIIIWSAFETSPDKFDGGWFTWNQAERGSYIKVHTGAGHLPLYTLVQYRHVDGPNAGYVFHAMGSAGSDGAVDAHNQIDVGGVVYAYAKNNFRLWSPDPSLSDRAAIVRLTIFGNSTFAHKSTIADVRIQFWGGRYYQQKEQRNSQMTFDAIDGDALRRKAKAWSRLERKSVNTIACAAACVNDKRCVALATPDEQRDVTATCDIFGTDFVSSNWTSEAGLKYFVLADIDLYE